MLGLGAALLGLGASACRGDRGPSLGIELRDLPPPPSDDDGPSAAVEPPPAPERDLFFADGPGRRAILARERQDRATAVQELDALLATPDLDRDARGVAELLRGLEDQAAQRYAAAAERFARARQAPVLRPLEVWLTWIEAQARLDGGDPKTAREKLEALSPAAIAASPFRADVAIARADAQSRTQAQTEAIAGYEAYLERYPKGRRRFEVQAKLAHLLAGREELAARKRAVVLYEQLLLQSPLSDYADEATKVLRSLRGAAGTEPSPAQAREFERALALARIEEALERRRYRVVLEEAEKVLKDGKLSDIQRCRVLYAQGSAVFRQRKRTEARPVFERAAAQCKTARATDYEVKSRYQAARGVFAEGRYRQAAQAFETLAQEQPGHSYADDAWILAGESWEHQPDAARAAEAYRKAVAVGGDLQDEARRRLLLQLFAGGDVEGALELCETSLRSGLSREVEAKFRYFRGKALHRLGRLAEAKSAWLEVLRADPLGYASLQALNRLREEGALQEAFAVLEAAHPETRSASSDEHVAARARAVLFARLGLGEQASQELEFAGIQGWPAAEVLDQAGLYAEGQRIVASMGAAWRREPPHAANRKRWELAHPRPFEDVVAAEQRRHGVPDLLAYAVMQTESRFDPGVTSWAGARGLIQLMPATAKMVAEAAGLKIRNEDLYNPERNLDLGLRYLSGLVQRFGGGDAAVPLAVPSYNAGPGAVNRWLKERGAWDLDLFIEAIPYDETRHYTQSVLGRWWAYRWLYGSGAERVPELRATVPAP